MSEIQRPAISTKDMEALMAKMSPEEALVVAELGGEFTKGVSWVLYNGETTGSRQTVKQSIDYIKSLNCEKDVQVHKLNKGYVVTIDPAFIVGVYESLEKKGLPIYTKATLNTALGMNLQAKQEFKKYLVDLVGNNTGGFTYKVQVGLFSLNKSNKAVISTGNEATSVSAFRLNLVDVSEVLKELGINLDTATVVPMFITPSNTCVVCNLSFKA